MTAGREGHTYRGVGLTQTRQHAKIAVLADDGQHSRARNF